MEENLRQREAKCSRVAFLGGESTGKTTICKVLATYFGTNWVAEYMRTYLQQKWDKTRTTCTWDDLLPIAVGQMKHENELAKTANSYLFCDTNLMEICIYAYIYYGMCPPEIEEAALANRYDFVFLTDIDVPWQPDDLRDKPNERQEVLDFFKEYLSRHKIPYVFLSGNETQRLQKVVSLLKNEDKNLL